MVDTKFAPTPGSIHERHARSPVHTQNDLMRADGIIVSADDQFDLKIEASLYPQGES